MHGYHQSKTTPGLSQHVTRPITFCLLVDNFFWYQIYRQGACRTSHSRFEGKICHHDKLGRYKIHWFRHRMGLQNHHADISMHGYIPATLARFQHPNPTRPQHSPHAWLKLVYGAEPQMTAPPETSAALSAAEITTLQQIIGTLLYYARAVDSLMLVALGSLASAQSKQPKTP
jgi:hypothetical protein